MKGAWGIIAVAAFCRAQAALGDRGENRAPRHIYQGPASLDSEHVFRRGSGTEILEVVVFLTGIMGSILANLSSMSTNDRNMRTAVYQQTGRFLRLATATQEALWTMATLKVQ